MLPAVSHSLRGFAESAQLLSGSAHRASRNSRFALRCGLLALWLLAGGWTYDLWAAEKIAERFCQVTDAAEYRHAHWGILFVDVEKGEVLLEQNADKLFAPASTTKLYSVACALDALGADFCFETPIYRRGQVDEHGTLRGDLILVASGDLSLGGRTDAQGRIAFKDHDHTYATPNGKAELTEPDPLAGIRELAAQVAAAGIKRVQGDLLMDDRLFEQTSSSGSGPARVSPLMINDNVIDLLITPGEAGAAASVTWRPHSAALAVDAEVETAPAQSVTRVEISRPAAGRLVVRGRIAEDRKPLVLVKELEDPAAFCRSLLIEALAAANVSVQASSLETHRTNALPAAGEYAKLVGVARLKSPPFSESVKLVLKVSHNLHASTLPLLVASRFGERTLEAGLHRQHAFLSRAGVEVNSISFGGGAGGSRADYTTPRATVQLLRYMSTRPDFEVYRTALPVLGVDGTSAEHVAPGSPVRGKVYAKTGTLYWDNTMNGNSIMTSKALAGYLTASSGRRLAFALFVNNAFVKSSSETAQAGKTLGRLCEIAYQAW